MENFSLVISRRGNSEILLSHDAERYSLPQLSVPRSPRVAEAITAKLTELWNLPSICLFSLSQRNEFSPHAECEYEILEPRDSNWNPPEGLCWVKREMLDIANGFPQEQQSVIKDALQYADAYNSGAKFGPFARAGWLDELISWIEPRLARVGLVLAGKYQQFKADPLSTLIRFETNGPAVWFKAVDEANLSEFLVTAGLTNSHPEHVPKILAKHHPCHGWLMEEFRGKPLENVWDFEQWKDAVTSLARIQVDYCRSPVELLRWGCQDWRFDKILERIDPFFESIGEVLHQPVAHGRVLTWTELQELVRGIKQTFLRFMTLGVYESLVRRNFGDGNTLVNETGCVFLDWAECCAGHPFWAFEHLLAVLKKGRTENSEWERILRGAYSGVWRRYVPEAALTQLHALSPLMTTLLDALKSFHKLKIAGLNQQFLGRDLRSFVWRLKREFEKLAAVEAV